MVEATLEDKYSLRKYLRKNFKKSISKHMSIKCTSFYDSKNADLWKFFLKKKDIHFCRKNVSK